MEVKDESNSCYWMGTADTEALMGTIARDKVPFIQDHMQGN